MASIMYMYSEFAILHVHVETNHNNVPKAASRQKSKEQKAITGMFYIYMYM